MSTKNIEMQVKTASGYDTLYPYTLSSNVKIPQDLADNAELPTNSNNVSTLDQLVQVTGGNVGDLKLSTRNDLGSQWLYCNGDEVMVSEYPQLAERFVNVSKPVTTIYNNLNIFGYPPFNPYPMKFHCYDGTNFILIRADADKPLINNGSELYYVENEEEFFNKDNQHWEKVENFLNINTSYYILSFQYLNGKYVILSYQEKSSATEFYIMYANSFSDVLNKRWTINKICTVNYLLPYNQYLKGSNLFAYKIIYDNNTYSFVCPMTKTSGASTDNRGVYLFKSSNLTSFTYSKIFKFIAPDSEKSTSIKQIYGYKKINQYYIIFGSVSVYESSVDKIISGYPFIAFTTSLNENWNINTNIFEYSVFKGEIKDMDERCGMLDIVYYENNYLGVGIFIKREGKKDDTDIANSGYALRFVYGNSLSQNIWNYKDIYTPLYNFYNISQFYPQIYIINNKVCIPNYRITSENNNGLLDIVFEYTENYKNNDMWKTKLIVNPSIYTNTSQYFNKFNIYYIDTVYLFIDYIYNKYIISTHYIFKYNAGSSETSLSQYYQGYVTTDKFVLPELSGEPYQMYIKAE